MRLDPGIAKPLTLGLGLGVALGSGTLIPIQRLGLAPLAALVRAEQLGKRILSVGLAMLHCGLRGTVSRDRRGKAVTPHLLLSFLRHTIYCDIR